VRAAVEWRCPIGAAAAGVAADALANAAALPQCALRAQAVV